MNASETALVNEKTHMVEIQPEENKSHFSEKSQKNILFLKEKIDFENLIEMMENDPEGFFDDEDFLPDTIEPLLIVKRNGAYSTAQQLPAEKIIPYSKRFSIDNSTTKKELESLKMSALNAGIKMDYHAKYRNGSLKKLKLEMKLIQENNGKNEEQIIITKVEVDKDFDYVIGWAENEKGEATQLRCGDEKSFNNNLTIINNNGGYPVQIYDSLKCFRYKIDSLSTYNWPIDSAFHQLSNNTFPYFLDSIHSLNGINYFSLENMDSLLAFTDSISLSYYDRFNHYDSLVFIQLEHLEDKFENLWEDLKINWDNIEGDFEDIWYELEGNQSYIEVNFEELWENLEINMDELNDKLESIDFEDIDWSDFKKDMDKFKKDLEKRAKKNARKTQS